MLVGLFGLPAHAIESVTSFDSRIEIQSDGSLRVTETIDVVSEQREIRHGIYRDFVIPSGAEIVVETLERDGNREAWRTETTQDGLRIYFGSANQLLSNGPHTYVFSYEARGFIVPFKDHDELYWNVTGNEWSFPISNASASIQFPPEIPSDAVQFEAFSGPEGTRESNFAVSFQGHLIYIDVPSVLEPGSGLTILFGAERGYLAATETSFLDFLSEPVALLLFGTDASERGTVIRHRPLLNAIWVGLALVLVYYVGVWFLVGIDPAKGRIVPTAEPPAGLSPAAMRYITHMNYDDKTFTVALITMATLGNIKIRKKDFHYEISLGDEDSSVLSAEGKIVSKALGLGKLTRIKTTDSLGGALREASAQLYAHLDETYRDVYFTKNKWQWIVGAGISLAAMCFAAFKWNPLGALAIMIIGVIFGGTVFYTLNRIWKTVLEIRRGGLHSVTWTTRFQVTMLIIVSGAGAFFLSLMSTPVFTVYVSVLSFLVLAFGYLLPAPTKLGREALNAIESFKMYLEDIKRIPGYDDMGTKDQAALFHRYLPYAIALDVDRNWTRHFESAIEKNMDETYQNQKSGHSISDADYFVDWYVMDHGVGCSNFTFSLSSACASTGSGLSTGTGGIGGGFSGGGFSGGGFSGGGGGGGGGGGW